MKVYKCKFKNLNWLNSLKDGFYPSLIHDNICQISHAYCLSNLTKISMMMLGEVTMNFECA